MSRPIWVRGRCRGRLGSTLACRIQKEHSQKIELLRRKDDREAVTDKPSDVSKIDGADGADISVSTLAIIENGLRLPAELSAASHRMWFGSGLEISFPEHLERAE